MSTGRDRDDEREDYVTCHADVVFDVGVNSTASLGTAQFKAL